MMYSEFLEMSGARHITGKQYAEVVEPMYNASSMAKAEFVDFIRPALKSLERETKAAERRAESVVFLATSRDMNKPWTSYLGQWVKLVDWDVRVRDGRKSFVIRDLDPEEWEEMADDWRGIGPGTQSYNWPDIQSGVDIVRWAH